MWTSPPPCMAWGACGAPPCMAWGACGPPPWITCSPPPGRPGKRPPLPSIRITCISTFFIASMFSMSLMMNSKSPPSSHSTSHSISTPRSHSSQPSQFSSPQPPSISMMCIPPASPKVTLPSASIMMLAPSGSDSSSMISCSTLFS